MSSPRGSNVALPLHLQSKSARRRARKKNARRRRALTEESVTSTSPQDASGSKTRSSLYLTAAQEGPASAHKPLTPRAMSALLNPTATDDGTRFARPTSPPLSLDDADKQIRELKQTLDALRESRATQRLELQRKSKDASDHVRAVRAKEQQANVRQYEMDSKLQDLENLLAFVNTTRTDGRWVKCVPAKLDSVTAAPHLKEQLATLPLESTLSARSPRSGRKGLRRPPTRWLSLIHI